MPNEMKVKVVPERSNVKIADDTSIKIVESLKQLIKKNSAFDHDGAVKLFLTNELDFANSEHQKFLVSALTSIATCFFDSSKDYSKAYKKLIKSRSKPTQTDLNTWFDSLLESLPGLVGKHAQMQLATSVESLNKELAEEGCSARTGEVAIQDAPISEKHTPCTYWEFQLEINEFIRSSNKIKGLNAGDRYTYSQCVIKVNSKEANENAALSDILERLIVNCVAKCFAPAILSSEGIISNNVKLTFLSEFKWYMAICKNDVEVFMPQTIKQFPEGLPDKVKVEWNTFKKTQHERKIQHIKNATQQLQNFLATDVVAGEINKYLNTLKQQNLVLDAEITSDDWSSDLDTDKKDYDSDKKDYDSVVAEVTQRHNLLSKALEVITELEQRDHYHVNDLSLPSPQYPDTAKFKSSSIANRAVNKALTDCLERQKAQKMKRAKANEAAGTNALIKDLSSYNEGGLLSSENLTALISRADLYLGSYKNDNESEKACYAIEQIEKELQFCKENQRQIGLLSAQRNVAMTSLQTAKALAVGYTAHPYRLMNKKAQAELTALKSVCETSIKELNELKLEGNLHQDLSKSLENCKSKIVLKFAELKIKEEATKSVINNLLEFLSLQWLIDAIRKGRDGIKKKRNPQDKYPSRRAKAEHVRSELTQFFSPPPKCSTTEIGEQPPSTPTPVC